MFTGIVQKNGTVKSISLTREYASIQISVQKDFLVDASVGDSIAVNGVCLTVNVCGTDYFQADVMKETLDKSNLSIVKAGSKVNLEKAARLDSFLGGHIVQGHVDSTAALDSVSQLDKQWIMSFQVDKNITSQLFPKASVAINGISLTVLDVLPNSFSVSVIPTTYKETNISLLKKGDKVNIETDVIGKYVVNYLKNQKNGMGITKGFLQENGF